jgi:hypothetical protein
VKQVALLLPQSGRKKGDGTSPIVYLLDGVPFQNALERLTMTTKNFQDVFPQEILDKLFGRQRSDMFFEALYGDISEGAYDISLAFKGHSRKKLLFAFQLSPRPGKCLACSLTYGLPQVFARHPAIDINGLVQKINERLDDQATCSTWQLGATQERSRELHVIPLTIYLDD